MSRRFRNVRRRVDIPFLTRFDVRTTGLHETVNDDDVPTYRRIFATTALSKTPLDEGGASLQFDSTTRLIELRRANLLGSQ